MDAIIVNQNRNSDFEKVHAAILDQYFIEVEKTNRRVEDLGPHRGTRTTYDIVPVGRDEVIGLHIVYENQYSRAVSSEVKSSLPTVRRNCDNLMTQREEKESRGIVDGKWQNPEMAVRTT